MNVSNTLDLTHAECIKRNEYKAANLLLERLKTHKSDTSILSLGDFAKEAYQRVGEIFEWDDFENCQDMIMIGCGPLPVTTLHVAEKFPSIKIQALDVDEGALEVARQVIEALDVEQLELIHNDSVSYEFGLASIIYIANLVRPKSEILKQIAKTAELGSLVILRDPTKAGIEVAEAGVSHIRSNFKIEGFGEDSDVFMSKHIFLRLVKR